MYSSLKKKMFETTWMNFFSEFQPAAFLILRKFCFRSCTSRTHTVCFRFLCPRTTQSYTCDLRISSRYTWCIQRSFFWLTYSRRFLGRIFKNWILSPAALGFLHHGEPLLEIFQKLPQRHSCYMSSRFRCSGIIEIVLCFICRFNSFPCRQHIRCAGYSKPCSSASSRSNNLASMSSRFLILTLTHLRGTVKFITYTYGEARDICIPEIERELGRQNFRGYKDNQHDSTYDWRIKKIVQFQMNM